MTSAELIREARTRAGLTQAHVAELAGTTQATVARMERPGSNPTFSSLDRVIRATGHALELSRHQVSENIDVTLIAANLRLTPAERLRRFVAWHESLRRMTEAADRSRGTAS